ncbi:MULTISPECIES: hypothetical protein [unclassified Nitrospina]|uniref:hypothetical protein n=1 Tax=unclassified Nitrospina TaxID=2638683 RepID=UPI003F96A203
METKKQSNKTKWIALPFFAGVFLLLPGMQVSASEIDLSTPESTVLGYCRGAGEDVQKYFDEYYEPVDPEVFGYPGWVDCKVLEVKKTDFAGKIFKQDLVIREEDVELITEVTISTRKFGEIQGHHTYILRKFKEGWKIVSHFRMEDEYFKDVDLMHFKGRIKP